jgi:UDP-glucose/GDP-mannose dehydrogenase family, NAD binding domain
LQFFASPGEAVRSSEIVFICVGTTTLRNGDADLSAIDRVAQIISTEGGGPKLIVEKSTVPAQTGQSLQRAFAVYTRKSGVKFRVASNPEFLRESTDVSDFFHPDRIVIGADEPGDAKQLEEIYRPILDRKFRCPAHDGSCPGFAAPKLMPMWLSTYSSQRREAPASRMSPLWDASCSQLIRIIEKHLFTGGDAGAKQC